MASHAQRREKNGAVDVNTVHWSTVDVGAETILSPEQLALFKTTQPSGPRGVGTRFQAILNHLIDEGDRADARTRMGRVDSR